jgi:hypothetical protein
LPLCDEAKGAALTLPSFVTDSFRNIVRDNGELHLRVVTSLPVGSTQLIVVTSEPLDKELVGSIAADLGEITLLAPRVTTVQSATSPESTRGITVSSASSPASPFRQIDRRSLPSFTVGSLPVATRSFDQEVLFPSAS